jgi:hypothetical protein
MLNISQEVDDVSTFMTMGVWQGVDSVMFHPSPPCPTLLILNPEGGEPLKRSKGRFRGGLPTGRVAVFDPFGHPTPLCL